MFYNFSSKQNSQKNIINKCAGKEICLYEIKKSIKLLMNKFNEILHIDVGAISKFKDETQ